MRRLNIVVLACCLLNFACTKNSSSGDSAANTSNEIKIGQYGSMTGGEATFGQSTDKGVRLAIDAKNATGGIKGKKIV
jgi:ABC-type branched-subunit amino acid transport system substrate-binding protein